MSKLDKHIDDYRILKEKYQYRYYLFKKIGERN